MDRAIFDGRSTKAAGSCRCGRQPGGTVFIATASKYIEYHQLTQRWSGGSRFGSPPFFSLDFQLRSVYCTQSGSGAPRGRRPSAAGNRRRIDDSAPNTELKREPRANRGRARRCDPRRPHPRMPTEPFQPKTPLHGSSGAGRPLKEKGSQKTCLNNHFVSVDRELFSDRQEFS